MKRSAYVMYGIAAVIMIVALILNPKVFLATGSLLSAGFILGYYTGNGKLDRFWQWIEGSKKEEELVQDNWCTVSSGVKRRGRT